MSRIHEEVEVERRFRRTDTFLEFVKRTVKKILKEKGIKAYDVVICPTCYDVLEPPGEHELGVFEVWGEIFGDLNNQIGEFESGWLYDETRKTAYVYKGTIWIKIWR